MKNFSKNFESNLISRDIDLIGVSSDFDVENIRVENARYHFDYVSEKGRIESMRTQMPGQHNIFNTSVAIYLAQMLGCKSKNIKSAVEKL